MKLPSIKIKSVLSCGVLSRGLIALLFVVAGILKLSAFNQFYPSLTQMLPIPASLAFVLGALVIFIEIPVAIAYAIGWKYVKAGWTIIGFTILVTIFYHNPWQGGMFNPANLILALKNIAIIGGIMATIGCYCGKSCFCGTCKVK